jgi:peptidoglycan/LPS O-acetylase OafA/YrhL
MCQRVFIMTGKRRPQQLHAVNAIRVIAEYLVVRFHVLRDEGGHGVIGLDILSFFFVLSGFVMMYSFQDEDFASWQAKLAFIKTRLARVYPIFLLGWLFNLPSKVFYPSPFEHNCWIHKLCPVVQLAMLDSWIGCSGKFTFNGVSWFLTCLFWLWVAFPIMKNFLVEHLFCGKHIWVKLFAINLIWSFWFYLLWDQTIYTLSPMPPLRLGEFLMGCGAALAPNSWMSTNKYYWLPTILVIFVYMLERVDHGMTWICLREEVAPDTCTLWHAVQERLVEVKTPCVTVVEKILNKYALVWACVIHGVARQELAMYEKTRNDPDYRDGAWVMRVLQADIFKTLSRISLSVYLLHFSMYQAIVWLGQRLLGWDPSTWHSDAMLFLVYLSCYAIHYGLIWLISTLDTFKYRPVALANTEDEIELVRPVIT